MGWGTYIKELQHQVKRQIEWPAPRGGDFTPRLYAEPETVKPGIALSIPI